MRKVTKPVSREASRAGSDFLMSPELSRKTHQKMKKEVILAKVNVSFDNPQ